MKILILFIIGIHLTAGVIHSHSWIYTGTSGIPGFPEFISVCIVDGQQVNYYDNNLMEMIPKQEWVKGAVDADFWKRNTQNMIGAHQSFKANIGIAKERFNQTGGIHTVQRMYGCELDDETGATDGYDQYGYDGADFISLDLRSTSYVAPVPQAVITKQKNDGATAEYQKNYLTQTCLEWLKKYVQYGKISLERKVHPQVSLLQTDPSSPVVCHATGFYPDKVMISWQKDGQDLHEDVDVGETLPNHDGTFQKRAELNMASDERKKNQFTCVVEHKSGDPIHMILTDKIRTNRAGNDVPGIVAGLVVAALVLIAVVVGVVMVVKRRSGYKKTSQSDAGSNSSGAAAQPLHT
ncbi:class I histocompatibility antigen, F10 alpha chain-like [Denticeps clupeoides]|uniref:class I histocompatibility antigen, F10 alpha chain-like n=1 Tax=Denticeps clupeoides TaxID=299321 RepID=UPI0010A53249|nr:class I histocompatibility antigen, F10 alpha chain-like [Denticeps clupeoides]